MHREAECGADVVPRACAAPSPSCLWCKREKGRSGQTGGEPPGVLPDLLQGKCLYSRNLRVACFPSLIQPAVKRQADQDGHGVGTLEGKQEREVPKGR